MTNRGSVALSSTSQRCSASSAADGGLVGGVDPGGDEPRVAGRRDRLLGAGEVVVGDDEALDERAAGGDRGDRAADTAGADQQDAHVHLRWSAVTLADAFRRVTKC